MNNAANTGREFTAEEIADCEAFLAEHRATTAVEVEAQRAHGRKLCERERAGK